MIWSFSKHDKADGFELRRQINQKEMVEYLVKDLWQFSFEKYRHIRIKMMKLNIQT